MTITSALDNGSYTDNKRVNAGISLPVRLILAFVGVCTAMLALMGLMRVDFTATFTYMQQHPVQVLPAFILACIAGVVLVCPGAVFLMLSGALYGTVLGAAIAFLGVFCGQNCAFLLGRSMFRDTLAVWINKRFPTWLVIERALFQQGGLKMIVLVRLSPILPDSVMNYALAITNIKPLVFASGSALGLLPYAVLYASVGSASSDIAKTLSGGGSDSSNPKMKVAVAVVSALLFAVLLYYVATTLKKALAEAQSHHPHTSHDSSNENSHHNGLHGLHHHRHAVGEDEEGVRLDLESQPLLGGR